MEILSLGSKIKLKRKEKNMKLKDLAGDRITPGQISLIETGKSNPSEDLLRYIAEKLETKVEYFLESEEKQAEDVCKFYANIAAASIDCENYLRAEENIEKGILYSEKYNVVLFQGIFNYQMAQLFYKKDNYSKAQKYALSSLITFLKVHDSLYIIKAFLLLGETGIKIGDYNLAYNYFQEAEINYESSNITDKLLRVKIYYYIAKCLNRLSKHHKAIDYAVMIENELKEIGDYKLYEDTLMILAVSYCEQDNKKEAVRYAEKAKEICRHNEDFLTISHIEEDIGEFLINSLNIEDGIEHLKSALEIRNVLKGKGVETIVLKIISGLIKCKKYNRAFKYIEALEDKIDLDSNSKIKMFELKYKIYKEKNDDANAEKQILNLIRFLEVIDEEEKLLYYYMLIANFYSEIGEDKLSLTFFKKAFDIQQNQYKE